MVCVIGSPSLGPPRESAPGDVRVRAEFRVMARDGLRLRVRVEMGVEVRVRVRLTHGVKLKVSVRGGTYFHTELHAMQGC